MLPIATDENLREEILEGLRRRLPALDSRRVQDVLGHRVPDDLALAWAAAEGRLLLTHDGATVPDFAYARIAAGLPMPGVLVLQHDVATAIAVGELTILLAAGKEADFRDFVLRVPLR